MKECTYTVRKHVVEECMKEVRCTEWRTEVQHCEREVTRTVKKPVTEMRTISKVVGEWCTEEYTVPGRKMVKWVREQECEFDPCTCKCVCKPGKWTKCETQCPDQVCSRRVYRTRTICCEVPVTKNVKECIVEKVPYTVCKKVPVTVCKQVPVKVSKVVCETCTKQVPVTTTRMVTEKVVKSVPYTTRRVAHGAYVDSKDGMGYADPGEGRSFVEGAKYQKVVTTTRRRLVSETVVKKVPYTVYKDVQETCTKMVPYTTCRMVPCTQKKTVACKVTEMVTETHTKKVPYTVCSMEPCTINKTVSEKVTKMVPHTVTVKVPYTVCEQVPVTTCKRVPVCVEKEVCVKKPRLVAVCNDPCDPCHLSRLNDRLCGKGGPCDPGPQAPSDPGTKGGKGGDTKGSGK
jgi:hypothetical protein